MSIAAAGIGAAGSLVGGLISSSASSSAAKQQQAATQEALAQQNAQWQYSANNLQDYVNSGINAQSREQDLLDNYSGTVTPSLNNLLNLGNSATAQAALAQTPGYQFTLQQGLQSTQNAAAARGLGVSGAALKGAATYATGLADNTYQQQYSNALNNYQAASSNFQNQFNANQSIASTGASAAANNASTTQQAANNSSNLITGGGNAAASGTIGSANALSGAFSGAAGSATNTLLLNQYLGGNGSAFSGSAAASQPGSPTFDPND